MLYKWKFNFCILGLTHILKGYSVFLDARDCLDTQGENHALAFVVEELSHALNLWVFESANQHHSDFLLLLQHHLLLDHSLQIAHVTAVHRSLSYMLLELELFRLFLILIVDGWWLSSQINHFYIYEGSHIGLDSVGWSLEHNDELLLSLWTEP